MTSDVMRLNTLSPAPGHKKPAKRVGRGIGSGFGKTCGRGHKGQKSRSGGTVRAGFEGGQMPLQKRLPKYGFTARKSRFGAQVRTSELAGLDAALVDLQVLKDANIIGDHIKRAKVFLSGTVGKAVTLKGISVSKGARDEIEGAGGKIEE